MIYKNRVWLQGRVISAPKMMELGSKTHATSFYLSVVESWQDHSGNRKERRSSFQIEVVGRDAQRIFDSVRVGHWVTLDGYLRSEIVRGADVTKVRVYDIEAWEEPHADSGSPDAEVQDGPHRP